MGIGWFLGLGNVSLHLQIEKFDSFFPNPFGHSSMLSIPNPLPFLCTPLPRRNPDHFLPESERDEYQRA